MKYHYKIELIYLEPIDPTIGMLKSPSQREMNGNPIIEYRY